MCQYPMYCSVAWHPAERTTQAIVFGRALFEVWSGLVSWRVFAVVYHAYKPHYGPRQFIVQTLDIACKHCYICMIGMYGANKLWSGSENV